MFGYFTGCKELKNIKRSLCCCPPKSFLNTCFRNFIFGNLPSDKIFDKTKMIIPCSLSQSPINSRSPISRCNQWFGDWVGYKKIKYFFKSVFCSVSKCMINIAVRNEFFCDFIGCKKFKNFYVSMFSCSA